MPNTSSQPSTSVASATASPLGGEPPVSQCFLLEVTGVEVGLFMEVSGLEMTVGVEPLNEGGVNGFTRHLPGRVTWGNLTLKRGLTQDDTLMKWIAQSDSSGAFDLARTKVPRTTAAVTVVDRQGNRLRGWELIDAFPVRWSGPSLSINENSIMTESLEIAHHGFSVNYYGGAGK